jgi:hypothetical protein
MGQAPESVRSCYDAVAREYADRYAGELRRSAGAGLVGSLFPV